MSVAQRFPTFEDLVKVGFLYSKYCEGGFELELQLGEGCFLQNVARLALKKILQTLFKAGLLTEKEKKKLEKLSCAEEENRQVRQPQSAQ